MMTLLGGAGSFFGPFVGAVVLLVLQEEFSRVTEYWSLIIGAMLMLCVRYFPEGACGWLQERFATIRSGAGSSSARRPHRSQATTPPKLVELGHKVE